MVLVVLSACSNNNSATATEEDVQQTVQNIYDEMTKLDKLGISSLEHFNTTLASYSAGNATDKELEKAVEEFQDTASEIADQVEKVKVSRSLPEDIQTLLKDSLTDFKKAYSLKEQASQGAISPEVTAEEFDEMNQQADVAMLFGISKLNEARAAVGLVEGESSTEDAEPKDGTEESNKDIQVDSPAGTGTNAGEGSGNTGK